MPFEVISANPIDPSIYNAIPENMPTPEEALKLLTLWIVNDSGQIKFDKLTNIAKIRIRFKDQKQFSHMVLKGFNISKFSLEAGLMDESNIEILRDDIFTKEVKYDKNQEDKTFAQNMKTTKNKE